MKAIFPFRLLCLPLDDLLFGHNTKSWLFVLGVPAIFPAQETTEQTCPWVHMKDLYKNEHPTTQPALLSAMGKTAASCRYRNLTMKFVQNVFLSYLCHLILSTI